MDKTCKERAKRVARSINNWLRPDNDLLKKAIDRTVQEGLFSMSDIRYQIRALKKEATEAALLEWVGELNCVDGDPARVLCLHAGNLPLVGFQDVLAVALSGAGYAGKISKKDPYLLPTFFPHLQAEGLLNNAIWSTDLNTMDGVNSDAVLFSGSTDTVDHILPVLYQQDMVKPNVPILQRTAHYSMAYIHDAEPTTMRNLVDSVFRYGGQGCRSVALVVAPFSLRSEKCHFTDYVESFWLHSPQHIKARPALYHRFAYNKAMGYEQMWLDHFLVEETTMHPTEPFVLHWVVGGLETVKQLALDYEDGLQAVYSSGPEFTAGRFKAEPLVSAQQPPISWKPDGTDPLQWLCNVLQTTHKGS
ncbi:MAG: hypothetical protein ACNA78_00055 [Balneolaceae bacterium]